MKRKNMPGCNCCCGCQELQDFLSTQPGTISGYTPLHNWTTNFTLNGCCGTRRYARNTPSLGYVCEDTCVPDNRTSALNFPFIQEDLPDCIRFGRQIEAKRGTHITLYISRFNYSCPPLEGCDKDNNPATAFCGCKYVLSALYEDDLTLQFVTQGPQEVVCTGLGPGFYENAFLCDPPVIGEDPPPPCLDPPPIASCPAVSTCDDPTTGFCDGVKICNCGGATAYWFRSKAPFSSLPTGTISFGNNDTYACSAYSCHPFPTEFVTTTQCVSFSEGGYCGNLNFTQLCASLIGIPGCEDAYSNPENLEYCLSPPSFSVVFP